jgi:adenylosuccinate synthase
MTVTVVVGCGWGDEGKGTVVDALAAARRAELVIRFNGGPNAGHTVVPEVESSEIDELPAWNRRVFRLHQVPSGVFTSGCISLVGPGTVFDPGGFLEEIATLEAHGVATSGVMVSDRAHLVLPVHRDRDRLLEAARAAFDEKLVQGTTLRGVGPAYEDKMARIGLRAGDLLDEPYLAGYLPFWVQEQNRRLAGAGVEPLKLSDVVALCEQWAEMLANRIVDGYPLVQGALKRGADAILEGQLGAGRDVDWGIYPDVTSSGATAGAAGASAGVPPRAIGEVVGVVKAFATSVGGGPLVTELFGDLGDRLRVAGGSETEHEYGATTGRPRRCGWFDAVAARQAAALNGCTGLAVTKLDALDGFGELQIATAYELDGERVDYVPSNSRTLARARPVYETLPGWSEPAREIRDWDDLPEQARDYVERIETLVGVPVTYVGTGPSRLAVIQRG